MQVIQTVVRCSTRWWCTTNDRQVPTDESELFYAEMRAAVIHLTSEVYNGHGLNVIAMATTHGSVPIVQELLNIPNVYRFRQRDAIVYDVTYLAPRTMTRLKRKNTVSTCKSNGLKYLENRESSAIIGLLDSANAVGQVVLSATESTVTGLVNESCLELIASMSDEILAARILDVEPYRQLIRNKWSHYQYMYVFLLLVHIVYMALYSVYAVPSSSALLAVYNTTSMNETMVSCISFTESPHLYGLFLIWPCMISIFTTFQMVSRLVRCTANSRCSPSACNWCTPSTNGYQLFMLPFHLLRLFFTHVEEISALAFSVLTFAWYVLYRCGTTSQAYVQVSALVLIVGWLYTLNYTKGFEEMHSFTAMLKWIIVLDVTRFVLLYICVLLGFGMAFQVLFQISPTIAAEHGSTGNTLFTVFNLMLGLGSPLDASFGSVYTTDGGDPSFVYWIYIVYIVISSIILINLLVAMMNDSYSGIKANEGSTWKVNSLQLALRFEKTMPLLLKLLRGTVRHDPIFYDEHMGRWMLSVPSCTVLSSFDETVSKDKSIETLRIIQRVEEKIDRLETAHSELAKQVNIVTDIPQRSGALR